MANVSFNNPNGPTVPAASAKAPPASTAAAGTVGLASDHFSPSAPASDAATIQAANALLKKQRYLETHIRPGFEPQAMFAQLGTMLTGASDPMAVTAKRIADQAIAINGQYANASTESGYAIAVGEQAVAFDALRHLMAIAARTDKGVAQAPADTKALWAAQGLMKSQRHLQSHALPGFDEHALLVQVSTMLADAKDPRAVTAKRLADDTLAKTARLAQNPQTNYEPVIAANVAGLDALEAVLKQVPRPPKPPEAHHAWWQFWK